MNQPVQMDLDRTVRTPKWSLRTLKWWLSGRWHGKQSTWAGKKGKQKQQFELQKNSITKMNLPWKGNRTTIHLCGCHENKTTINWWGGGKEPHSSHMTPPGVSTQEVLVFRRRHTPQLPPKRKTIINLCALAADASCPRRRLLPSPSPPPPPPILPPWPWPSYWCLDDTSRCSWCCWCCNMLPDKIASGAGNKMKKSKNQPVRHPTFV